MQIYLTSNTKLVVAATAELTFQKGLVIPPHGKHINVFLRLFDFKWENAYPAAGLLQPGLDLQSMNIVMKTKVTLVGSAQMNLKKCPYYVLTEICNFFLRGGESACHVENNAKQLHFKSCDPWPGAWGVCTYLLPPLQTKRGL